MSFSEISDPTDLTRIKAVIAAAESPERLVPLGISQMHISWNAADQIVPVVAELLTARSIETARAKVLLLTDTVETLKGQLDFKSQVFERLGKHFDVEWFQIEAVGAVKVDDKTLDLATEAARGFDVLVGLGAGTISDIVKVASDRLGGVAIVTVQTAASVDGYTDNVSVVLRNGAKRTIASRWPDAVISDLEVIQSAPLDLNLAGFGEAISLFTAPADWELASMLGMDSTFHSTPRDLLLKFAGDPAVWGQGLSEGKLDAVEQLTKVLAIRGIGTGIAGTTACLSGVEHLISHMLDMRAGAKHQQVGLHGAQVGVASLVGAMAWRYLLENIQEIELPRQLDRSGVFEAVAEAFADMEDGGQITTECLADVTKKLDSWWLAQPQALKLLSQFRQDPGSLERLVPNADSLASGLLTSGAPSGIEDLEPWITPEIWEWAVSNCHLMRNRFTVIDLLYFAGRWKPEDARAVIQMAKDAVSKALT